MALPANSLKLLDRSTAASAASFNPVPLKTAKVVLMQSWPQQYAAINRQVTVAREILQ